MYQMKNTFCEGRYCPHS